LSGGGSITLGSATLTASSADTGTFSGVISGTGTLVKAGTGAEILTGTNTYTGGTTVSGGVLSIGNGSTSGAIAGNVVDNSLLLFNRSDNVLFSGNVSGSGQVYQEGSGILSLAGSNSYSGATFVANGTLQAQGLNVFSPNSDVYVLGGTTLDLNSFNQTTGALAGSGSVTLGSATLTTNGGNANSTFAGVISGTGGLIKSGSGTLLLSNNNSYTGTTAVGAGVLQLGNGGTTGSVSGNISVGSGATLVFDRSDSVTYSGTISGAGGVTQSGGTLILSGTNTYQGGTTIASGTLVVGDGGTSGSIVGNISNNALLLFARSDNITFAGNISGTGQVYLQGGGTLTLTGTNNYSGETFVSAGTLKAGAANTFSPNSDMYVLGGTTLDLNSFNQTTGALSGSGSVTLGSATLTASSANTSTFSGVMSGTGGYTKAGTGNTIFTGNNTYTGTTTINGGALSIGNGGTTGTIAGPIADNSVLLFNRSDNILFSGNISGTGQMYQEGSGILALAGSNSYSGATFVANGTLQAQGLNVFSPNSDTYVLGGTTLDLNGFNQVIGALVGSGSVHLGGGKLTVTSRSNSAFSGVISGTGIVAQGGTKTLTLSGSNTYSGGTTISSGTIEAANSNALGTGTVTMSGGTLLLDNSVTISDAVSITSSSFIDVNGSDTATISGQLSGSAPFEKDGTGTLILTNTNNVNTYSGNISYHGTLTCGNGSCGSGTVTFLGTILALNDGYTVNNPLVLSDNGYVSVASGSASITGAISESNGPWGLTKSGPGLLNLTGSGTYTGPTIVSDGTLVLGGTIKSGVLVKSGATLGLSGTVLGGVTVASGGTIAAVNTGAAPAVLSTSSLTDQGGTYVVRFNSDNTSDRIVASGAVALGNGTVDAIPTAAASAYTFDQRYTIISTAQPVTGAFSNPAGFVANPQDPVLLQRLRYDQSGVVLEVRHLLDFTQMGGADTANEIAVAKAIDRSEPNASDAWASVVDSLARMTPSERQSAYNQMSGSTVLSSLESSVDGLIAFDDLVQAHAIGITQGAEGAFAATSIAEGGSSSSGIGAKAWVTTLYGGQPAAGFATHGGYLSSTNQTVAGLEVDLSEHASFGFAFAANQPFASSSAFTGRSSGTATSYGAYARYRFSGAVVALTASEIDTNLGESREIAMGNIGGAAGGYLHQQAEDVGLSLTLPSLFKDLHLTPVGSLRYLSFGQDALDETATVDSLALNIATRRSALATANLGLDWQDQFESKDLIFTPEIGTYLQFAGGDTAPSALVTLKGAPAGTGTFLTRGDGLSPVSETVTAGLNIGTLGSDLSFDIRSTARLSAGAIQSSAQLHLDWRW
jgi:autotransporter-associated beta strand protein